MEAYVKDFEGWNIQKKRLDSQSRSLTFYEKEIWWCSTGINIGSEQDGKGKMFIRPVYVLKKITHNTFVGIPITSKMRCDYTHVPFYFDYDLQTAILSQIKVIDKKRLYRIMGTTSDYLHSKMKKATVAFLLS